MFRCQTIKKSIFAAYFFFCLQFGFSSTNQRIVINVINNDPQADSTQKIQDAIDFALKSEKKAEIKLGSGFYKVSTKSKAALMIHKAMDITITGQGEKTLIVCGNPQASVFQIQESSNIIIRDVVIDYDPLPFTQGTIVAVDRGGKTFDVKIDDEFDELNEHWFLETNQEYCKWGIIFDPYGIGLKKEAPDHTFINSWQSLGERVWRLKVAERNINNLGYMNVNDRFVQLARGIGIPAIMVNKSSDCVVNNVAIHSSPCEAIVLFDSDNFKCSGLKVCRPENSNRLISTDSDGIHCRSNVIGPVIENCYFEGMADDTINIYSSPFAIKEVVNESSFVINLNGRFQVGDKLQIFDSVRGKIYSEPIVEKISKSLPNDLVVNVDRPLFNADEPGELSDVGVFNLSASGQGYIIRNNYIGPHRRHGILVRSGRGLIESNRICGVGGLGIVVANAPDWPEGPAADGIIIRGNIITEVGYSKGHADSKQFGAITVKGLKCGNELSEDKIQQNITIENNRIVNPIERAIYIGSAQKVNIKNNVIEKSKQFNMTDVEAFIVLEKTEQLTLENLQIKSDLQSAIRPVDIINHDSVQRDVMLEINLEQK